MTEEEKQLVFKDLCARLPYGVVVERTYIPENNGYTSKLSANTLDIVLDDNWSVKPYLRPMSSMTEEEKNEVAKLGVCYDGAFHNDVYDVGTSMEEAFLAISWLIERHFDINYLINKGLALEAKEGMYKNE